MRDSLSFDVVVILVMGAFACLALVVGMAFRDTETGRRMVMTQRGRYNWVKLAGGLFACAVIWLTVRVLTVGTHIGWVAIAVVVACVLCLAASQWIKVHPSVTAYRVRKNRYRLTDDVRRGDSDSLYFRRGGV